MEKVRHASKPKLEKLLFTLLDDCEKVDAKNFMLKDAYSELKKDMRLLEKSKQELERKNDILISENFKLKKRPLLYAKNLTSLRTS